MVAADDGVKPQTLEALKAINDAKIPFLVAISKIDKSNADLEKTKSSLLEHGIYLEGMGGDVPYVPIDSKSGTGIPELLDLLLLAADLEELTGDPTIPATGSVIESHCDAKRGISATIIIKNGILRTGDYIVAGEAYAPLRIVENFLGKKITEAKFSSPVMVTGFSENPPVGAQFSIEKNKKLAIDKTKENAQVEKVVRDMSSGAMSGDTRYSLPIILKSDVVGSIDAIKHELKKHENERTLLQVIHEGVGNIAEGDVKYASGNKDAIVIGFNVGVDTPAKELAERMDIEIATFSIIYDLADWLAGAIKSRRPKVRGEKELGKATVLKSFSFSKKTQTVGCRVDSGEFTVKDQIIIKHGDEELGRGRIVSLKSGATDTSKITAGNDCGLVMEVNLEKEPKYNDTITAFIVTEE
jgi:translation initiation factor IF-2